MEEEEPIRKTSHYINAFAALLSRALGTLPEQLLLQWRRMCRAAKRVITSTLLQHCFHAHLEHFLSSCCSGGWGQPGRRSGCGAAGSKVIYIASSCAFVCRRLCAFVYICVYMYVCVHVCLCICVCACACVCACVCICVCLYMCACVHMRDCEPA